jgi:uncharacterized protein involved in response to NO
MGVMTGALSANTIASSAHAAFCHKTRLKGNIKIVIIFFIVIPLACLLRQVFYSRMINDFTWSTAFAVFSIFRIFLVRQTKDGEN